MKFGIIDVTVRVKWLAKCFIIVSSFVNYCLFLILKIYHKKVNNCIAIVRHGFLLIEVTVALVLSLCIITFFTLTLGHTFSQLHYQKDRLTALCYARSALNKCCIDQTKAGTFTTTSGRFTAEVHCVADASYQRLVHYESTVTWPQGSLTLRSGIVV